MRGRGRGWIRGRRSGCRRGNWVLEGREERACGGDARGCLVGMVVVGVVVVDGLRDVREGAGGLAGAAGSERERRDMGRAFGQGLLEAYACIFSLSSML